MNTIHTTSNDLSFGCPIFYMETIHITNIDHSFTWMSNHLHRHYGHYQHCISMYTWLCSSPLGNTIILKHNLSCGSSISQTATATLGKTC